MSATLNVEEHHFGDNFKGDVEHAEPNPAAKAASGQMSSNQIAEAYRASLREHQMDFLSAVRIYKKALAWTLVMGTAIIMEGYDLVLINGLIALEAFRVKFGHKLANGTYQLEPQWQTALTLGNNVGLILGIFANGVLVDRWGHRRVVQVALVICTGFITILFCAKSQGMLLAGEILLGFPLGMINTTAPSYAIEVAPLALRHYGPTYVNLAIVFGQILASGILRALVNNTSEWGWRIPYAVQWAWPLPLFILLCFAPDSPWWLVRKGRFDKARATLDRLSDSSQVDNDQYLAMVQHTVELEKQLSFGGSYLDCFRGYDLRRTEIAVMCWSSQSWTGFGLVSATYFFTVEGISSTQAFDLGIGNYLLGGVGTMIGMALLQRLGRRTLWFIGLWGIIICLLLIAILSLIPNQTGGLIWAQGVLLIVRQLAYGVATGPIPFVYCGEIPSVTLRLKTLGLARNSFYAANIINAAAGSYLINPSAANLKGKSAWVPVGFCTIIIIWSYFRFPETKGRTFEELDIMFAKKLPARQFKNYKVEKEDVYGDQARDKLGEIDRENELLSKKPAIYNLITQTLSDSIYYLL